MSQAVADRPIEPDVRVPLVAHLLQPVILLAALAYWYFNAEDPATYLAVLVLVQVLLGCLEYALPARRDLQPVRLSLAERVAVPLPDRRRISSRHTQQRWSTESYVRPNS